MCANPGCGNRFLYLKSGKLFHFPQPHGRQVDTYWLCEKCVDDVRLEWRIGEGVIAILVEAGPPSIYGHEDGRAKPSVE